MLLGALLGFAVGCLLAACFLAMVLCQSSGIEPPRPDGMP